MKYVLIDGNNLAIRAAFANEELRNHNDIPTGVHFGFFQSLISLKKQFDQHQFLIVWDGKSKRRMKESEEGVKQGIIPSLYKANRKKDEIPQPLLNFFEQSSYLQKGIEQTGIPQIRIFDFEADDVIASYSHALKEENEVVVVTSDKDFWQILDVNVSLWDGMKGIETTKSSWETSYELEAIRAIDIGALVGDSGDNIFGIPGWGEKTAIKELKKHGTWEKTIQSYHEKYDGLKEKYPDLKDKEEFNELASLKSNPKNQNSRLKFPEIKFDMPFTGVCKALSDGQIKIPKNELMALMFEKRVELAYSLKKMDTDIKNLPKIEKLYYNKNKMLEYLDYFDIESLKNEVDIFDEEINSLALDNI